MSSLKLKLNTDALAGMLKGYAKEVEKDVMRGVATLAAQTKAHVVEQAENELSSPNFIKFQKSVGLDDISPGIWVVSIDEKGLWIEEGIPPNTDMKPGLLKGRAFRVIPFDHAKPKSQSTGYESNLRERVKASLRKQNIPFKKIEMDGNSPKTGLLHKFDLGGETPGKGNTPVLDRVSIYQTVTASGNVRRDILTFRTVSAGPASAGKWFHPGYQAKKFLDKAADWAEKEWEQTILPEIISKWTK